MQELIELLLGYARGMWHRRWAGLAVAWLVAVIGAVVVFRLPDKYEASARVYVDTQSLLKPLMRGMAVTPDASQQVSILSKQLISRPNVEKIIRKSDLDTSAKRRAEDLIDETMASLRIGRAEGGGNMYTIAYRYPDGRKARDVVQAALSIFIEQSLGENRTDADAARKFLDQQIADYEQKLQEAEARKQAFRLKYLGLLGTSGKNYLHQMEAVGEQIKEARVQIRVAEQTRDGLRRQLEEQTTGGNATNPKAVPRIAVPEIDARIDAQKRQLDELLRKYTDQHPDVVGVKRTMARLEDERNAEIEARAKAAADKPDPSFSGNPIAQQLKVALNESEATVTTARARLGEHEARYNQLRAAAESLPKIETELGQLDRDYDVQKRQYDSLIQRRETANLSGKLEDANVAEFRIVEPPRVSPKPVAPNRLLLLAALLGGSLAAGLVSAFAVSQVRPTFHGGRALAEVAGRPLLGIISVVLNPEIRHRQRRSTLVFAGGMGGLLVCFGATFAFTLLTLRSY
jgi:polysaccharide chain length determinant protein (PEP-CTERM system associated)